MAAPERPQGRAQPWRVIRHEWEDFLGIVAHELRTPVAVVKAYVEYLQARALEADWGADDRQVLSHVAEQVELMADLIEQLLDVQRLRRGKLGLELNRFDLVELARRAVEDARQTAPDHRLSLLAPGRPLVVLADRRRVREVLNNLLDNAIRFAPGGTIEVEVGSLKRQAVVSVKDNGIGLAAEDRERIFGRFEQGQAGLWRGHLGLGLGLYLAQAIVHAHGGRIWAESAGPGQGSTFRFTLPISGPREQRARPPFAPAGASAYRESISAPAAE